MQTNSFLIKLQPKVAYNFAKKWTPLQLFFKNKVHLQKIDFKERILMAGSVNEINSLSLTSEIPFSILSYKKLVSHSH